MDRTDVLIIGAGAVGCATAYFLAKEGLKVTVIESNTVAFGASGYAMGLLAPLSGAGIPGPLEELSLEGFRMHLKLADELMEASGIPYNAQARDSFYLAFTDDQLSDLESLERYSRKVEGISCHWMNGPEILELEPRVSNRVTKALLVKGTWLLDSYHYTRALAEAARKIDVTICHDKVHGLKKNGTTIQVITDNGLIETPKVVLSMGPWTGIAQEWLGLPVPVYPLKGQILHLELPGPNLDWTLHHGSNYAGSKSDGTLWIGTTEECMGFDDQPTVAAKDQILTEVASFFPAVQEGRLVNQTACLRPVTSDSLPILGEVPGWNGVYLSTGAGRKGILLSPAMALATTELVTTGRCKLSVDIFSPARFACTPAE